MSVATRLPFEILAEIFVHCLHWAAIHGTVKLHPKQVPVLLTRVCRQWRNVAYGVPKLWAACKLPPFRDEGAIPLLRSWLSYSDPLSLTIDASFAEACIGAVSPDLEAKQIAAMCAHSGRWKHVQLYPVHTISFRTLKASLWPSDVTIDDLMNRLSNLIDLQISIPYLPFDDNTAERDLFAIICACRALQSLKVIRRSSFRPIPVGFKVPKSLRHLHLAYAGAQSLDPLQRADFVEALSQLTALDSLHLEFPDADHFLTDLASRPSTVLPAVHSLVIEGSIPSAVSCVLTTLFLPALKTIKLSVRQCYSTFRDTTAGFDSLLRHCAPALQSVELSGYDGAIEISNYFMNTHGLRALALRRAALGCTYIRILKALTVPSPPNICATFDGSQTGIRSVALDSIYFDFDDSVLVNMPSASRNAARAVWQPYEEVFLALVRMVSSRSLEIPENVFTADGERVEPLSSLVLGAVAAEVYQRCSHHFRAATRERWESIFYVMKEDIEFDSPRF